MQDVHPATDELRTKLIQEWRFPTEASQPVMIEAAGDRFNPTTHLYVIWDRWTELSQSERSEVIMDAYEATHDRQQVLTVTIAMGLTAKEAERMGIQYETEAAA